MQIPNRVDVLILGAGWTAEFLIPLLQERGVSFSATTRDGRVVAGVKTIPFELRRGNTKTEEKKTDWKRVPTARTIVIVLPIEENGVVTDYVEGYEAVHGREITTGWLQLGSTGAWNDVSPDVFRVR